MIRTAAQMLADIGSESKPMGRPRLNLTCTLKECGRVHKAKGLCERHRHVQARWGDPHHVWVRPRKRRGPLTCDCPVHRVG